MVFTGTVNSAYVFGQPCREPHQPIPFIFIRQALNTVDEQN